MDNLELILKSIREKAEKEENQILEKSQNEAKNILEDMANKAKKEADKILADAKKEADLTLSNEKVSAKREARDIIISGKNSAIESVLDKLLVSLKSMNESSYKDYVLNTLKNSNIEKGEILLEDRFKNIFSQADLGNLKISDETVDEGFIVRDGKIEYDNRFSSLIKYKSDDIKKQISDILFKWGD